MSAVEVHVRALLGDFGPEVSAADGLCWTAVGEEAVRVHVCFLAVQMRDRGKEVKVAKGPRPAAVHRSLAMTRAAR